VRLRWTDPEGDDQEWEGSLVTAFIANGQYCGGGMQVGRGGSMQDGAADLVVVPRLPTARLLAGIPRLYTGHVERVRGVLRSRIVSLDAEAVDAAAVPVEVDGEQPGSLPLHVRVLPGTLLVRGTWK
jgi:diacylglycerol kinase (ATP)